MRDLRRRRRHELRHLPDPRRPACRCSTRATSSACRSSRRWVDVRSIGAGGGSIARVDRRRPAAGRPAERRAPCPGRRATAAAARSRRSPTPPSCSGCSATVASPAASRSTRERAEAALAPLAERLGAGRRRRGGARRRCAIATRRDGRRDPRDHRRARPRPARGRADGVRRRRPAVRDAAGGRARARPLRDARRSPATSRPGACSAPTSCRPPSRTRLVRLADDAAPRPSTRSPRSCSPSSRRAPAADGSAARGAPRPALPRPGADADDRGRRARTGRARRRRRRRRSTPPSARVPRTFGHAMDERARARHACARSVARCRASSPRLPRAGEQRGGARRRSRGVLVRRGDVARAFALVERAALGAGDVARRARRSCARRRRPPTWTPASRPSVHPNGALIATEAARMSVDGRSPTPVDPITTEVVRHGLNSAAEQMKRALVRTAFSPVIYEVLDFAAALYDRDVRDCSPRRPSLPHLHGHDELLRRGARSRRSAARTRSSRATSSSTTCPTAPARTRRTSPS